MHDVDTEKGHEKCLELAQIDEKMGFRSSFNFVPERYNVSSEVRRILVEKGFEVGVHGLKHDGKLFSSRRRFQEQAVRINHYLKDWESVGFVSPSMHRNLDWIHDLNVEYDASTFDTDPFEPQPEGLGSIFPFWVPATRNPLPEFGCSEAGTPARPAGGRNSKPETVLRNGFIELPYTLPQDHTLFVLMQERDISIWKNKLDWIAEKGGMALVITHPDYMNFEGKRGSVGEYSVLYYEEFLAYVKNRYGKEFWIALPKEVAEFWANNPYLKAAAKRVAYHGNRVCMLSYSFYENDNRVMRYAETLSKRGDRVDVIALRKNGQPKFETLRGVNIYRIQERTHDEKGKYSYLGRLIRFLINSSLFLSKEHLKDPYRLVHVHSIPDFEVFAAFLPKLSGAKVILDIHDIVPELYASKFKGGNNNFTFKALVSIEKASISFSDHVIISNHIWERKLLSRSVKKEKCTVILNYPDPSFFFRRIRIRNDGKFIMMYPGTLNWHQGLDIAIKAFSIIHKKIPEAEFHIYGRGSEMENLRRLIDRIGLNECVFLKPLLPIDQIGEIMANADLGIIPKLNDPFGGEAFSTKILEFMSLGVPVIVAETKIDKYYFNDSVVKFFKAGDVENLSTAMLEMIRNPDLRMTLAQNALKYVEEFSWDKRKWEYLDLVDRLTSKKC